MSGYTLRLKPGVAGIIDGSPLRPDTAGALPRAELDRVPITVGSRAIPLAEAFAVEGGPGKSLTVVLPEADGAPADGPVRRALFDRLGAGMAGGAMIVEGDAGDLCGAGMSGGGILVNGRAGRLLGAGMRDGQIRVIGPVGEQAGGPPPEATKGMTGGEILVAGVLGPRAGFRMRRGLLACTGIAGEHPGHAMIAGTIVEGRGGLVRPGLEMKRGTLMALDAAAAHDLGPNWGRDGRGKPVILRVLLRRLMELKFPVPAEAMEAFYDSFSGDRLGTGKGEVFVRVGK